MHDPMTYETIGLYRDVWIAAIASSTTSLATRTAAICVRFQGRRVRRVYVTMQMTSLTRKSALIYRRGLRQRVASLTLNCNGDFAIRAYVQAQRWRWRRTPAVPRRCHVEAALRSRRLDRRSENFGRAIATMTQLQWISRITTH